MGLGTPETPTALGLTWFSGVETVTQRKFHLLHRSGDCHLLPTPSHSLVHLKPVLSWHSSACLIPAHSSSSQAKSGDKLGPPTGARQGDAELQTQPKHCTHISSPACNLSISSEHKGMELRSLATPLKPLCFSFILGEAE